MQKLRKCIVPCGNSTTNRCGRFVQLTKRVACYLFIIAVCLVFLRPSHAASGAPNFRKPVDDEDLKFWLQNMVAYHRFSIDEVSAATGLESGIIKDDLMRFGISPGLRRKRGDGDSLVVLPYPGGRHPRIGFLDGAIRPQRESKISVFTPWDESSYVVVDVPEAIWSNHGLTYLAHTHIDTVWTKQNVEMEPLEWRRLPNGILEIERMLPNGIRFGAKVMPHPDSVRMELRLFNGTSQTLNDLRVQNCVMLKGAAEFNQLTNDNKILSKPYGACRSSDGRRWVISAWEPCDRLWANAPVPCLHSDPKFPDCLPGETKVLKGWLSFYQGVDIIGEFNRIEATGWRSSRQ